MLTCVTVATVPSRAARAVHALARGDRAGPGRAPPTSTPSGWGHDPQLVDVAVLQFVLRLQISAACRSSAPRDNQVCWRDDGRRLTSPPERSGVTWRGRWISSCTILHMELVARDHPLGNPETIVNGHSARRLGIPLARLRHNTGWKVIER